MGLSVSLWDYSNSRGRNVRHSSITFLQPVRKPVKHYLPLMLSPVSAGFPSPAEDYQEARIDLGEYLVQHPAATFYARLGEHANSMTGAGIYPGDIVVVDRSLDAAPGDVVLACINGDFTLKRYCKENGVIWLKAENPAYPPIHFSEGDEMQIWGVVKHSIRNL